MSTKSITSRKKWTSIKTANQANNKRTSGKTKDDRMLEKVEKYVNKNREKTSQEIMERKSKRPTKKFQEWDLDVLISRISIESKPKDKTKKTSKLILYIIYTIIIIAILTFIIKFFFTWNMPQNW